MFFASRGIPHVKTVSQREQRYENNSLPQVEFEPKKSPISHATRQDVHFTCLSPQKQEYRRGLAILSKILLF